MDRALGILGASVLAALIALLLALPQGGEGPATSPTQNVQPAQENWSALNDSEKLDRLEEDTPQSQEAIFNEAVAYDEPSRCDDLTNTVLRERCHDQVSETDSTSDSASNSEASNMTPDMRTLNEAVAYDDPSRCESIQNASLRQHCNTLT